MSESVPSGQAAPVTTRAGDAPRGVVAVLSHHASLAMQLRRAGFDVHEGRDFDDLAKASTSVDIFVVDLIAVDGKRAIVARLSTAVDPRIPIVLLSADEVDVALLGTGRAVDIVVPPVRADDVISRVRTLLAARAAELTPAVQPAGRSAGKAAKVGLRPGPRASRAAAKAQGASSTGTVTEIRDRKRLPPRRTPARRVDEGASRPQPTELPAPSGAPNHSMPVAAPPATAPSAKPVPAAQVAAPTQPGPVSSAAPAVPTRAAAVATASTQQPTAGPVSPLPAPVLDWRVIANQLTQAVQSIPAVGVVAQTMADELAAASGAHVAVMVRDDAGTWHVEAGVGLRSFEWAQTLQDDDWLVWAGRDQHPSLMVMDTDVVRGDLTGAPLASRLQLVRTHSTKAGFFVCAGWEDDGGGNDTARVALVVEAVRRHSPTMADALGVRSLAEWLSAHVLGVDATATD
jgi:hypothetical protein